MICDHEGKSRWLHDTAKECFEAGCSSESEICNEAVCVDCGASVDINDKTIV